MDADEDCKKMNNNLNTNYLFKALDAYPFDLAETIEALNYALAYDENDVEALYLMALVYGYQLQDHPKAIEYCEEVIAIKIDFPKVYPLYIQVLLNHEEHEKVQKVLDFALTLKGSDKAVLMLYQGLLFERLNKYKKALRAFKKAKIMGLNNDFTNYMDNEISRVKNKIKPGRSNKKKKKSKSKKKTK
jgi:tetratricopeptide (TPR) repeat protein